MKDCSRPACMVVAAEHAGLLIRVRELETENARLLQELDLARLTVERLTRERDEAQPAEDWARQRGLKLGRRKKT